jgi:hypothetical protein
VADRSLRDGRVLGASRSLLPALDAKGGSRKARRREEARLDRALVDMVTRNPALTLHWNDYAGSIKKDKRADLVLIRDPKGKPRAGLPDTPYRALIDADEADVRLVTVDGEAVVASRRRMKVLSPGDFEMVPGALGGKAAIDVTTSGPPEGTETLAQFSAELAAALRALGGDAQPPGGGTAPNTNTYSYLKARWGGGVHAATTDAAFRTVLTNQFGTDAMGRLNLEAVQLKPLMDRDDDFLGHLLNGRTAGGLFVDPSPPFGLYPANLTHIGPSGNPLAGLP